ncbi:MAG: hypothetical protein HYV16_15775 [Gammaproteobacteria bacterium]|nr:hypothetical protein [Gammaproteobacteria bacterium]
MSELAALRAASRGEADYPRQLQLAGQSFQAESLLRALPGKRLVVAGRYGERPAVAKCFLDARRGAAHARRELEGLERLRAAGLATPELLASLTLEGAPLLLTAFLPEAQALSRLWDGLDRESKARWLQRAVGDLARLHGAGHGHRDAHFGNLLVDGETLVWLDGDAVQPLASPAEAEANLALFLAQLPAYDIPLAETAYEVYAAARGLAGDWPRFERETLFGARRTRLAQQYSKAGRECTAVHVEQGPGRWFACRRELAGADWETFIAEPDALFQHPLALLKDGNSATVIRTRLAGRDVVLKRYNLKDFGHGLAVALRPVSRARNAFAFGLMLEKLGLGTPSPLAVLETRWGPWRRQCYLVCDYSPARDCREGLQEEPRLTGVIGACLNGLWAAGLCHGDLKASNVLELAGQPVLIDLDSMRLAKDPEDLRRGRDKDRLRFLRNFREQPELAAGFSLD